MIIFVASRRHCWMFQPHRRDNDVRETYATWLMWKLGQLRSDPASGNVLLPHTFKVCSHQPANQSHSPYEAPMNMLPTLLVPQSCCMLWMLRHNNIKCVHAFRRPLPAAVFPPNVTPKQRRSNTTTSLGAELHIIFRCWMASPNARQKKHHMAVSLSSTECRSQLNVRICVFDPLIIRRRPKYFEWSSTAFLKYHHAAAVDSNEHWH